MGVAFPLVVIAGLGVLLIGVIVVIILAIVLANNKK